ncbi:hypothetical protein FP2506_05661 [Fulvimarina pelagi HTCC2506]|uniref:Uncharacterized protein n=1 Tax=Fulvimarina pelagi HTCC2506 TaxID=314231 RepID=Q0G7R4_9HYPH|nr:hypothetical protein [Fulvimarina pelagi]EAU42300.1 hypothetical protein FP2506_05661 [Fulvimarina pelagi HTCC2506]
MGEIGKIVRAMKVEGLAEKLRGRLFAGREVCAAVHGEPSIWDGNKPTKQEIEIGFAQ